MACRTFQHTLALLLMLDATTAGREADDRMVATIRRAAEATEDLLERRDAWLPTVADILGEGAGHVRDRAGRAAVLGRAVGADVP